MRHACTRISQSLEHAYVAVICRWCHTPSKQHQHLHSASVGCVQQISSSKMALLARTSLNLSRSTLAGCRGLVPAVQHTLRRHHATKTSAASPDDAGFPAAGANSGSSSCLQHSAVLYVGQAAASLMQQLYSSSAQGILVHVLCH